MPLLIRLLLLLTIVPLAELSLLLWLSDVTDWRLTLALVIGTGVAGSWLLRRQGWRTWRRLQDDLREEGGQLAPRDVEVAVEDRAKGAPLRRLLDRRCRDRAQRSVRPVRWMKTSSSVGVPSFTSCSARPCSARTAAAGATSSAASPVR